MKIFNKIDLIKDKAKIDFIRNSHKESILISAMRGMNISSLKSTLNELIEDQFVKAKIKLQLTDSKKVSQIHSLAEVLKIEYDEDGIKIHYKTSKQNSDKIKKIIKG